MSAFDLFRRRATFVLAVVLLLAAPVGAEEELSADTCLTCHGIEGFASPSGRPLSTDPQTFNASVHGSLPCTACHADVTAVPHAETLKRPGIDTCAGCHADEVDAYRQSIHGQGRANGITQAAGCVDCHGNVHAILPHTDPASTAHWSKLAVTCARCHANQEIAQKLSIPVVRPVEAYLASAHGRAVAAGRRAAVCSDCHGSHAILPGSDPRSSIWRTHVPETCGTCHQQVLAAYRDSVHGEAVARGVREAPVCTDCHGEHRILRTTEAASPVFAANIPRETCGRCHGDTRLSQKYGLSAGNVSAFEDSFHGLALRSGQLTVANCSSCHGVHDILPSSDPRSHVNAANLPATCGKCHPGAGARFTIGTVHVVATSASTRAVYWARLIYLWLIGLAIGGMVIHNALDVTRKARRPSAVAHTALAVVPERMPRVLRWQHGLVMLSFPILVYTGFTLKYPEAWWAAPLLRWENGVALRGLLHRCAAVVLLTSLTWHVVQLAVSRRLRACMGGLWWSWRDLRDAVAALAYSIGVRDRRPSSGRFSYIEKAEYWAFLWGTAVMALTGFLLWFENTALEYLPKWVTDLATAIHFYEAILATLAILVWHFYWVIFDPDVYPMDWSWWDGRPPAARALEREEEPDVTPAGETD